MPLHRPAAAALLLLSLAFPAFPARAAGPAAPRPRAEPWTAEDLVTAERAAGWCLAPDGRTAAWVKSEVREVDGEAKRVSNLWLTRVAAGESKPDSEPLTRGTDRVREPRFSPDGQTLAFLADRALPAGEGAAEEDEEEPKVQLWALPLRGGEPYPVTRLDREVIDFDWIDAETLLVLAQESPSARERSLDEASDDAVVVDDAENKPPVRLFKVKLEGDVRRLTANDDWIDSIAVSPDGKWAVATAQQSLSYEFDQRVPPRTFLIDLAAGTAKRLFADGALLPRDVRWALDSAGFYLVNDRTRHPTYRLATVADLWYHDLASGRTSQIDLGWERGVAGGVEPAPDGFLVLLADGVRNRAARYTRTAAGWQRRDLAGTHAGNLDAWALSRDGRTIVYQHSTATLPPQGWVARLDGALVMAERQLTDLNAGWAAKPTGRMEVLHWPGARNDMVEGLLYYPLDWKPGEKRPLVLDIHGGPAGADQDTWSESWGSPGILFRQRGAFVLQVNYHGSSGYGLDWVESIAGRYYELEIPDIEAGVDHLIQRGFVDPEKLASAGWSNGGILTAELITRTRRYKAASVGAADVEWISDWANVDFGASFDNYYFGAPPWEAPQVYVEKSPFFRLTAVTTPTIVYTGTEDRNVPPHQSWSLFRALQQIGKAPVRLVLFPGEPHGLREVAHQRRKVEEDLAWFDRYLFGRTPETNPAVQDGSLLAGLLQKRKAARTGNAFGRLAGDRLLPETVPFHGLDVGRFEVTRAQLAAFDPALFVASGEEDLPATGVPFEKARAYAAWLAQAAGRPYRLPTEEEAKELAEEAGDEGNTLDRWAGYTPNPRDRDAIRKVLAALPGEAPLLLPVGNLPPAGEGDNAVFDLDGNAAEWAVAKDGKGVAVGPSADRPNDPRSGDSPAPAYTGFRVVADLAKN